MMHTKQTLKEQVDSTVLAFKELMQNAAALGFYGVGAEVENSSEVLIELKKLDPDLLVSVIGGYVNTYWGDNMRFARHLREQADKAKGKSIADIEDELELM